MADLIPVAAVPAVTGALANDADTLDLARWAADAAASLASGIIEPGSVTELATLHAVTGALADLAKVLPTLCHHLASWLTDEYSAGRLGPDDHGQPPAAAAVPAWFQIEAAATSATSVTMALAAAQAAAGHLRRPGGEVW